MNILKNVKNLLRKILLLPGNLNLEPPVLPGRVFFLITEFDIDLIYSICSHSGQELIIIFIFSLLYER